jgi:hypothetical protein
MVRVDYLVGSVPAGCSHGSQRPLTLAGPKRFVLAAPIRWSGRFDITAAGLGSSIRIGGTFAGGSVSAFVHLSVVLPDGTSCTALTQTLVGSLFFPITSSGEEASFPGPPSPG